MPQTGQTDLLAETANIHNPISGEKNFKHSLVKWKKLLKDKYNGRSK